MGTFVAKPSEFNTLESKLKGLKLPFYINRNGEKLPSKFPSAKDIARYVMSGHVYIDYCGYPMYYSALGGVPFSRFPHFLDALGGGRRIYWLAFSPKELPIPVQKSSERNPFAGYPYPRGWVSFYGLHTYHPQGIYASSQAPWNVKRDAWYYGPLKRWVDLYVFSMVGIQAGKGWYFYAFGRTDGKSVDPNLYAEFIRSKVGVTGVVQPPTPPAPTPCNPDACTGTPTLKYGSKGHCVGWVQRRLNQLGFNAGPVDCIFGSQTDSAVRAFQRSKGLVVDGVVGPQTWAALKAGITIPTCPPGTQWNPATQRCEAVTPPPKCPTGTQWNPTTQQCEPVKPPTDWKTIAIAAGTVIIVGTGTYLIYKGVRG